MDEEQKTVTGLKKKFDDFTISGVRYQYTLSDQKQSRVGMWVGIDLALAAISGIAAYVVTTM